MLKQSKIVVPPPGDGLTGSEVPEPMMLIPLPETLTPEVHVHVPAGIMTVSPSDVILMAVWTSVELQEFAVNVVAKTGRQNVISAINKALMQIALIVAVLVVAFVLIKFLFPNPVKSPPAKYRIYRPSEDPAKLTMRGFDKNGNPTGNFTSALTIDPLQYRLRQNGYRPDSICDDPEAIEQWSLPGTSVGVAMLRRAKSS